MTLVRQPNGVYGGDFRYKGFARLHLSLRVRWADAQGRALPRRELAEAERVARARHDAIDKLFRQGRRDMIAQLTLPAGHPQRLTVERVAAMVEHHEPLAPIPAPVVTITMTSVSPWGTVRVMADRYLDWIDAHQRRSAGTHATVGPQLNRFCAFVYEGTTVGEMAFDRVTSAVVEAYQRAMIDGGAAPNTITAYVMRVGALWSWAEKRERRVAREDRREPRPLYSPVDTDAIYRKTTRRDRYLTADEGTRLLAATPFGLQAYIGLGLLAGLRRDEAAFLRRQDVDMEARTLTITAKTLPDGEEWTPKTKRGYRVVPIVPDLAELLARHLASAHAGAYWLTCRPNDADWPWSVRTLQEWTAEAIDRAGLVTGRKDPRGVTYHTLRHTFATHLASAGVDLYTLSKLLGDSLAVVETTYAHLLPEARAAAVAKLAGVFSLPPSDTSSHTI